MLADLEILGVDRVFETLAAKNLGHEERVKGWYDALSVMRYVGGQAVPVDMDVCGDLLARLLVSTCCVEKLCEAVDLFGCVFAYCSIHQSLQELCLNFVSRLEEDTNLSKLFGRLASCRENRLEVEEMPGFYDVVFQLESYETVDESVLRFLNFDLGPCLVQKWVPAWDSWKTSPFRVQGKLGDINVRLSLINDKLLLRAVHAYELDLVISNCQNCPEIWNLIFDPKSGTAMQYLMFKCARRCLKFSRWVSTSFVSRMADFFTEKVDNDSFCLLLQDEGTMHLKLIMEFIDHPELNLLEEPYLVSLLRTALGSITSILCRSEQYIFDLHELLGKMGSTQTLPSLLNILQHRLTTCCLAVLECGINGFHMENNAKWYKQMTNICIPSWFDELIPNIPPIPREPFGIDENTIELKQEATNFRDTFINIFESLQLLLIVNQEVTKFYGKADINPLVLDCQLISSPEMISNIQNKTTSLFFNMFFVPNVTTLLLAELLLLEDNANRTFLGKKTSVIGAKGLLRQSIKQIESIIDNNGSSGLYYFVKFVSQVSIESLSFQRLCMRLLQHLFFGGDKERMLQLCLSNELTTQSLYDYIMLWNDGSQLYAPFFSDIFKTAQPSVGMKSVVIGDLIELLPKDLKSQIYNSQPVQSTEKRPSRPKFNANAISFVPSETSNSNIHMRTPKRPHMNKYYSENPSPNLHNLSSMPCKNDFSNPMEIPPSLVDSFSGVFSSQPVSTSQIMDTWSTNPSASSFTERPQPKLVSTGKSYILGGHNRAVNNSRTKSVHVDDFEEL